MTEPAVTPALRPLEGLGRWATELVESLGRFGSFLAQALVALVTPPFKLWPLMGRIHYIGFRSRPCATWSRPHCWPASSPSR
jgi:ABC-type transporter Mla maintaining outer membrane lipid asymmetry permease subunit MlaE